MNNNSNPLNNAFANLGVEQLTHDTKKSLNEQLVGIEEKYNIVFPRSYREFLKNYNGVFFEREICFTPIEDPPNLTMERKHYLDVLFGLISENDENSLDQQINDYSNRMPNNLIPIGECPGGDLICIGLKGIISGMIYFWDHENEPQAKIMTEEEFTQNMDSYWENLYLVSETFVDFIQKLEIEDDDIENDDMEDVDLWLDDDLLDD